MKTFSVAVWVSVLMLGSVQLWSAEVAGAQQVQVYQLDNFSGIEASGGVQFVIKQDKAFSVRATGDQDALRSLDIHVRGRTLHIGFRPHFGIAWTKNVVVEVVMPELMVLRLSGAANGTINFDARHSPRVSFDISGGAGLQGVLIASGISGDVSGGSTLRIEGYAESATIQVNGGSRVESKDFAVDNAIFALSGGAYACLAVQSNIVVKASGGSHLDYRGKPDVRKRLSGGATVSQLK